MNKRISQNLVIPYYSNLFLNYGLLLFTYLTCGYALRQDSNHYLLDNTSSLASNSTEIEFNYDSSNLRFSAIGIGAIASLSILSGLLCSIYVYSNYFLNPERTQFTDEETKEEPHETHPNNTLI